MPGGEVAEPFLGVLGQASVDRDVVAGWRGRIAASVEEGGVDDERGALLGEALDEVRTGLVADGDGVEAREEAGNLGVVAGGGEVVACAGGVADPAAEIGQEVEKECRLPAAEAFNIPDLVTADDDGMVTVSHGGELAGCGAG